MDRYTSLTIGDAHRNRLLYIPKQVVHTVLQQYGETTFEELKQMAQPFMDQSITVLFGRLHIVDQFVYVMKDCEGDMQWSSFYGHNMFRRTCLNAHKQQLLTVFNICQSAVRTCAPFCEQYWYGVQEDGQVVRMYA